MNLLVLGATGQVGQELLKEVDNSNIKIFAPKKASVNLGDVNQLATAFEAFKPSIVVNAAAITEVDAAEENPKEAIRINFEAVENIAKLCAEKNIPLIHISTDYVFDGAKKDEYLEDDPTNPQTVYGSSKVNAEKSIQRYCKKFIVLRTSWVFSSFGKNFVKTMFNLMKKGEKIHVVDDQIGGPTSARAIAEVINKFIHNCIEKKQEKWGVYHFCQTPYVSWYGFAQSILKIGIDQGCFTKNIELFATTSSAYGAKAARPLNSKLNTRKINKHLHIDEKNWLPDLKRVIADLCEEKSNGKEL